MEEVHKCFVVRIFFIASADMLLRHTRAARSLVRETTLIRQLFRVLNYPTERFTDLKPRNQENCKTNVVQNCRLTDF